MTTRAVLSALRQGRAPDPDDIRAFAFGLADRSVSDAQAGAFTMGVCRGGLGAAGRVALTEAMRDSGDVLRWDLPGPIWDKHSTGGIGDAVSLILAPILAECGVFVPMISGRGLGHTGGTLDKLEAIPGVDTTVSEQKFRAMTQQIGCAIVSASGDMAPADRRLYAIRDVSGTVESVDLITASILSKKLAAGLQGLVLDVKCGSGAFMKTIDDARALAQSLTETSIGAGCPARAVITAMDQPLAPALGNATEIAACMEILSGENTAPRLRDLSLALCGEVLAGAGIDPARAEHALDSGAALDRFSRMIHALGGPPDMAQDWRAHLPMAPVIGAVTAPHSGTISQINGESLGLAVVAMGGGRQVETDRIDPAVGLTDVAPLGTKLAKGDPIATIHARTDAQAERTAQAIRAAITIGETADPLPLVIETI